LHYKFELTKYSLICNGDLSYKVKSKEALDLRVFKVWWRNSLVLYLKEVNDAVFMR